MRRPRFSLRAALLAFTLICVGLGLYKRHLVQQRLLEEAIRECGLLRVSPYLYPGGRLVLVHASDMTPDAARAINRAQYIQAIELWYRPFPSPEVQALLREEFDLQLDRGGTMKGTRR